MEHRVMHAGCCRIQHRTVGLRYRYDWPQHSSKKRSPHYRTITTKVYALGEGWTGALGTGRLDQSIHGHHDDDLPATTTAPLPVLTLTTPHSITSCDVGWGHTALIVDNQLLLTGRPHEISSLFRLARLPAFVRRWVVADMHVSTVTARDTHSVNPTNILGRTITYLSDLFLSSGTDWDLARSQSSMVAWTPLLQEKDLDDKPLSVVCSAGFTAYRGASGKVYMFGLNGMGQCGTGSTSNNVWKPSPITGLSTEFADGKRLDLEQSHPIKSVALGFQHGICLNEAGELFSWGKGARGQLGHDQVEAEAYTAMPITKVVVFDATKKPVYKHIGKISQIASGLIHSAALEEETNHVYIWGKNVLPPEEETENDSKRSLATDARFPVQLTGLPENQRVVKIACGSHHTSVLLDNGSVWAVGVATDTHQILHDPVCLIAPGVLQETIVQFTAHMDRTTIVTSTNQVYHVQLWAEPENQSVAVFTPDWVDALLTEDPSLRIKQVHRSWLHTIIISETE